MPKIGDKIRGEEIGHIGTNNYIWQVCSVCGKGNWIRYSKKKQIIPYKCHFCTAGAEETRKKISKANKGRVFTKKHKESLSKSLKGRIFTEEHRKNMGNSRKGIYPSEETKLKMSKAQSMERNHMWRGGITKSNGRLYFKVSNDYKFSSMKDHHGYVSMHRLVMAEHLQRPLTEEEVVHHIDKDITNNKIENLMLFSCNGEHSSYHWKMKRGTND